MTEKEKLIRDIETLRESVRIDFEDLGRLHLSREERRNLLKHAKWCALELNGLVLRLEALEDYNT